MKTKNDPRHLRRIACVKELFASSFHTQPVALEHTRKVLAKQSEIDKFIAKSAPEWPLDKIEKIDLAIIRSAVYELLHEEKTPSKVIIDEAIEIAKEFGKENSPKFVNGVLGTILLWTRKTS